MRGELKHPMKVITAVQTPLDGFWGPLPSWNIKLALFVNAGQENRLSGTGNTCYRGEYFVDLTAWE